MLMDLSKDIMMDLGITVIGDIIAILRHAKQVYRQVRSLTRTSLYVRVFVSRMADSNLSPPFYSGFL